jgi:hypothetical protein
VPTGLGFAVIPVLFEHNLRKAAATGAGDAVLTVAQVLGMEPAAARLRNPATDSEVVLALRVLEGCCLLCPACAAAAHRYNAVKVRTASRSVLLHLCCICFPPWEIWRPSLRVVRSSTMQCNAMQ